MTDLPIIFSAPMILALLDGRKTMTRWLAWRLADVGDNHTRLKTPWQRVKPGDRLWCRESLQCFNRATAQYVADITPVAAVDAVDRAIDGRAKWTWKNKALPAIHMPRWASRLTLIVTATKIERLQEISREDAIAEGMVLTSNIIEEFYRWPPPYDAGMWLSTPAAFRWLWEQLHGPGSWDANPEVVALSFETHKHNIDSMPKAEAA